VIRRVLFSGIFFKFLHIFLSGFFYLHISRGFQEFSFSLLKSLEWFLLLQQWLFEEKGSNIFLK